MSERNDGARKESVEPEAPGVAQLGERDAAKCRADYGATLNWMECSAMAFGISSLRTSVGISAE